MLLRPLQDARSSEAKNIPIERKIQVVSVCIDRSLNTDIPTRAALRDSAHGFEIQVEMTGTFPPHLQSQ